MTDTPRETRVLDAVVSLVDNLLDDFDVVDLLTELTERCAELLGCRGGGLSARRPAGPTALAGRDLRADPRTGTLPITGRRGALRGVLRHRPTGLGRGSARRDRALAAVRSGRARGRRRLRARGADARRRHRSWAPWVCSAAGPANSMRPTSWSRRHSRISRAWRSCRNSAPTPSTVIPQLRSALTSRVVVEQAKGFLRERLDISVDEAFSLLRRYARPRRASDRRGAAVDGGTGFPSGATGSMAQLAQG